MSVSYRGLKLMLCIQKLNSFGYTSLSVYLKSFSLPPCVCMCVKILSILKKIKNKVNSKKKCDVINEEGERVMGGVRTSHNCYNIVPNIKLGCKCV